MATAVATRRLAPAYEWRALLRATAAAEALGLAAVAVTLGDLESAALAVVVGLGILALRFRGGRPGAVVLGLIFVDVAVFMVTAAVANVVDGAGPGAVATPAALAAVSVLGIISAVGAVASGRRAVGSGLVRAVAGVAAAGFALTLVTAALVPARAIAAAGTLRVEAKNLRYSTATLAGAAGNVVVRVANGDLFWHTFTIAELGVDLAVPVGGEREVAFAAKPGVYTYYCRVPGHAEAGMRGTLTIR